VAISKRFQAFFHVFQLIAMLSSNTSGFGGGIFDGGMYMPMGYGGGRFWFCHCSMYLLFKSVFKYFCKPETFLFAKDTPPVPPSVQPRSQALPSF
jgi:hypothetical protein